MSVDARSNQPSRWLLDAARPPYPVPDRGDSTKIVTLPPGPARVSCGYDAAGQLRQRTTRRIRIVDPNGYWRPGTLESNGCRPSGIPSWAIGPRQGRTAHQAVERLVQSVRDLERPEERGEATLTARPLAAGYPDAREQAWLILRDGAASISVRVAPTVPRRGGNAAFTAFPDLPCSQ